MKRGRTARTLASGALCAFLFLIVQAASAHAVLVQSTPHPNDFVKGPDVAIELRFNSRVDAAHSTLVLLGPDGQTHALVALQGSSPGSIAAKAAQLTEGTYVLRWQALSTDGHVSRGELPFHVK